MLFNHCNKNFYVICLIISKHFWVTTVMCNMILAIISCSAKINITKEQKRVDVIYVLLLFSVNTKILISQGLQTEQNGLTDVIVLYHNNKYFSQFFLILFNIFVFKKNFC